MDGLPPEALTALYVARLDMIRNRAGALVAHAFSQVHLERLDEAAWNRLITSLYLAWVGTQLDAITTVDSYVNATGLANGLTPRRVPWIVEILVGRSVSGASILDILSATRRVVDARVAVGEPVAIAVAASSAYLSAAIGSDPHRVARNSVLDLAQSENPNIIGWRRVAEPDACRFCRMLATRGAVYTSRATASATSGARKYHHHCRCHVEPVTTQLERRRTIKQGAQEWARMLATGDVPRGARQHPAATAVDVHRAQLLQLQQLEATIPELAQRVAAGDTSAAAPLAWQQGRVNELRGLLTAAA